MHIAGKRLLWYLVPAEYDDHYDDYVNGLFAHGKLSQDDWLDLGALTAFPPRSTSAPPCGSSTRA